MPLIDRREPRLAVHELSEDRRAAISSATMSTSRRPNDRRGFVAPVDTVTQRRRRHLRVQARGLLADGGGARALARARWKPWGASRRRCRLRGRRRPTTRYSVEPVEGLLSSGPFQKMHLNGAYFGGERLDRFSKYQFGLFDETRMHGVPSAGVRFGELVDGARVVFVQRVRAVPARLFLDRACGPRSAIDRDRWRGSPAPGIAVNLRGTAQHDAPGRRRQELPAAALSRRSGSVVVQIMLLKPL